MANFKDIALAEEKRLESLIKETEEIFADDKKRIENIRREVSRLRQEKVDSLDYTEKNRIEQQIENLHKKASLYLAQDPKILRNPYFGVLELQDDKLGDLSYKIGKKTIFGKNGKVSVVDWREAPISRLFYEYDAHEKYDEDIRNQERSGIVSTKRKVVISSRQLKSVSEKDITITKDSSGNWISKSSASGSHDKKKEKQDHSLPEITSLISREQFQAITLSPEKTFILQGGAGSGKTTIGLHRIAYLNYRSPEKFKPYDILVLMYNKALQKYIKGVLPELGIASGVKTETFHKFALSLLSGAGINLKLKEGPISNTAIKKSYFAIRLVEDYLKILFEKSFKWLCEQFEKIHFDEGIDIISNTSDIGEFIGCLGTHKCFNSPEKNLPQEFISAKLLSRLLNHRLDLFKIFSDENFIIKTAKKANFPIDETQIKILAGSQKDFFSQGLNEFSDIGILIYLMQIKKIHGVLPRYSHIMVDEAQDLSPAELAAVLGASDEKNSVTICGDMNQKIKSDIFFSKSGFAGFIRGLSSTHSASIATETLQIGYRSTKEIMETAWKVMGKPSDYSTARSGEPVDIIKTGSFDETIFKAGHILSSYQKENPGALTCVICKFKKDADAAFNILKQNSSIKNIRRHERGDFIFTPGIIVTNVHQIKGLEFSCVMFLNPSSLAFTDDNSDRMLLHVAFTRASEKLWIIGHEKWLMIYK